MSDQPEATSIPSIDRLRQRLESSNLNRADRSVAKILTVQAALEAPKQHLSPLQALKAQVDALLIDGPPLALVAVQQLINAVDCQTVHVRLQEDSNFDLLCQNGPIIWKSCKLAATAVLILAASKARVQEALKFNSQLRGGLPTLHQVRSTPSQSLAQAFGKAKKAALDDGKTTIIGVSMVDVHIFELVERGTEQSYFSFAHSFVLGIGPEGMIVWQAWGEHGYRLDEWIARGGAKIRSWDEATAFVKDFLHLTLAKVCFYERTYRHE